ncbi:MAG TPA: hypothetical protein DD417_01695 [Elusimicrobia bacterium]|nr:hypothetical protein [Elusimicrobiota bacterium]
MAQQSILIIDDDQALVGALKDGLESLGYKVWAAFDGLQGVLQAHQGKPDVIMLDFNMPAGGGPGVYDRLRSSADTAKTPIIFLTGLSVDEVKDKIKPTPNTFFLRKPISVAQLQKVLEKILAPGGRAKGPVTGVRTISTPAPAARAAQSARMAQAAGAPATEPGTPLPKFRPVAAAEAPPPAPAPAPAPAGAFRFHEYEMRVTYADTDRLGIVYHSNYFKYFDVGRTELMRSAGYRYRDMERNLFMPIIEARCNYMAPSRYDEILVIKTWIAWLGPASVAFESDIREHDSARVVARGFTRHAVVNEFWKPIRLPKEFRERLLPFVFKPS